MNTDQMKPMTEDELENIKKEIKMIYILLISHPELDPNVVEMMKRSALEDVQKRFETGEPW